MVIASRRPPLMSLAMIGCLLAAASSGCMGYIGGSGSSETGTADGGATSSPSSSTNATTSPTSFTCDATQKPAVDTLRSLTSAQYQNTLRDLSSWMMNDPTAGATVLTEVNSAMASLPANVPVVPAGTFNPVFPDGGWLRADQDQQFIRVEAYYSVGIALAAALTNSSRLGTVVGSCATDTDASNDAACLTSFINKVAPRALRRAITQDDVDALTAVYGTSTTASAAAYADVLTVLFNAPEQVYLVEHGDQPVANMAGTYTLSAPELAARLSYHLWDTMPDDALWAVAMDGSLTQDSVYQAQVDRMFADPRTRTTLDRFYEDYMQTNSTGGPRGTGGLNYHDFVSNTQTPQFIAYAGSDMPTTATYGNLVADAVNLLDYFTWQTAGTLHDLLTTDLAFAQTADIAKIYGVPVWDGTSTPPSLPAGQRPGLFTRALFVAAGLDTSPILKGVYQRRYVLCDTLGPPPAAAAAATVMLSTNETTREVTTELTSVAPCSGCHPGYINPLGFATEDFDGLGRFRTQQTLFNADGTIANTLPIDTTGTPQVVLGDTTTTMTGASDLMASIDKSNKFGACMTRNYFRYSFARFEDLTLDGCSLETMRSQLDNNGSLLSMIKAVTQTPAFKQRTFE